MRPAVASGRADVARSQSLRLDAQQHVAQRPADDVRGVPGAPERREELLDRRRDRGRRCPRGPPTSGRARSVPSQEQVRPPRVVTVVGEIRREQRVDVAARFVRTLDRRRRASSSVLPPLRWLQPLHAVTRFSQVWLPPRWRGITWSRVRSWVWRPQYWQVWRSRAKTSRRLSLTRGRGRRMRYCSRMTLGARNSVRGVRTTWWSYSITSAFSPNTRRKARGRLQTLSGS